MMENCSRIKSEGYVNEDGFDRISELPDPILSQILSYLPTEDFYRVTLLSKRLKSLWSPLSVLDLDFTRFCGSYSGSNTKENIVERFTGFVIRMLALHQGQQLEQFRLVVDISENAFGRDNPLIRSWVRSAFRSTCRTLDIEFIGGRQGGSCENGYTYKLPGYKRKISVTTLKLTCCRFVLRGYKPFVSLSTLHLMEVQLSGYSLRELTYKCPVLENLHFEKCGLPSYFVFDVSSIKLKVFVMAFCDGLGDEEIYDIQICAPSLLKFKFQGDVPKYFDVDAEKLTEVEIYFLDFVLTLERHRMIHSLLLQINNVHTLKLCDSFLKLIGNGDEEAAKNLDTPLPNLKHLSLITRLRDYELKDFAGLLMCSPYLETLSIELVQPLWSVGDDYWESLLAPIECLHHHLKTLELKRFLGQSNQMKFLSYMLNNALFLDKVIIDMDSMKPLQDDRDKTIEKLLALGKSFPTVQFLLT